MTFNGFPTNCTPPACSLHLHAFTERTDQKDAFSFASAAGMMVGIGNLGTSLGEYNDGRLYITKDGGKHWQEISDNAHMFEIGNYGSILLVVNDEGPTDYIRYF